MFQGWNQGSVIIRSKFAFIPSAAPEGGGTRHDFTVRTTTIITGLAELQFTNLSLVIPHLSSQCWLQRSTMGVTSTRLALSRRAGKGGDCPLDAVVRGVATTHSRSGGNSASDSPSHLRVDFESQSESTSDPEAANDQEEESAELVNYKSSGENKVKKS